MVEFAAQSAYDRIDEQGGLFPEGYTMNPWRATIWTSTFLLVGAIAYAAAITTTLLIEWGLRLDSAPRAAVRTEGPRPDARQQRPLTAYDEVLERNIFGARRSVVRPVRQEAAARPAAAPAPPPEPFEVTLTGTFLSGEDSFAMVIGRDDREERVYRVGECVPQIGEESGRECTGNQARLAQIELNRIVVVKGGRKIPVEIGKGPPPGKSPRVSARAAPEPQAPERRRNALERLRIDRRSSVQPRPPAPQDAEPDNDAESNESANVFPSERVGNNLNFAVPHAEVDKAFENFSEVAAQAAAVPIIENGEPQGFQLRKIRPGSIFEKLGLKNFDLIRGVNGQSLTTADQALRLFTLFRNEREIVLDVRRRDEELKFSYNVE